MEIFKTNEKKIFKKLQGQKEKHGKNDLGLWRTSHEHIWRYGWILSWLCWCSLWTCSWWEQVHFRWGVQESFVGHHSFEGWKQTYPDSNEGMLPGHLKFSFFREGQKNLAESSLKFKQYLSKMDSNLFLYLLFTKSLLFGWIHYVSVYKKLFITNASEFFLAILRKIGKRLKPVHEISLVEISHRFLQSSEEWFGFLECTLLNLTTYLILHKFNWKWLISGCLPWWSSSS